MHARACFPASTQACRWVRPIPNAMVFIGIFSANRAVLRNLARHSACCQQVSSRNDEKEIFTHRCTLQIHWHCNACWVTWGLQYDYTAKAALSPALIQWNANCAPTSNQWRSAQLNTKQQLRIKWQRSYWLIESPTCNIRCATCFN